jgi:hypothetical protein
MSYLSRKIVGRKNQLNKKGYSNHQIDNPPYEPPSPVKEKKAPLIRKLDPVVLPPVTKMDKQIGYIIENTMPFNKSFGDHDAIQEYEATEGGVIRDLLDFEKMEELAHKRDNKRFSKDHPKYFYDPVTGTATMEVVQNPHTNQYDPEWFSGENPMVKKKKKTKTSVTVEDDQETMPPPTKRGPGRPSGSKDKQLRKPRSSFADQMYYDSSFISEAATSADETPFMAAGGGEVVRSKGKKSM